PERPYDPPVALLVAAPYGVSVGVEYVPRQRDGRRQHRVDVGRAEDRGRHGGEREQPMLQFAHLGVEALPRGDVAGDLRRADDRAVRVADGRHRQRHIDERAVLAPADRLEMIDAFATPDALEDEILFAEAI